MVISRQLGVAFDDQFYLAFNGSEPRFGLNTTVGNNQNTGAGSIPVGQWVHLAGVYDGTSMRLYVNGSEQATLSKSGTIKASDRPLLLGGNANTSDPQAASETLAGRVDEARLYNRALTAAEIAALAAVP